MPLYEDIAIELADRIAVEGRSVGDRVESENQLAREFQVSRGTVVKAMDVLEQRGIIRREQGRGTFVHGRPALESVTKLVSFTQFVAATGRRPGGRILDWGIVASDPDNQLHRPFEKGMELVEFRRLRTIDDVPVGMHRVVVPQAIATAVGLHAHLDADPHTAEPLRQPRAPWSFYAVLAQGGIHLGSANERFAAVLADSVTAAMLEVAEPCPLLRVERHTNDPTGHPIEVVEALYLSDRYAVTARSIWRPGLK